jgi:hypothetical protein
LRLFIPDAHDKVALIALQLAASQIRVQLLGPSGWANPDLVRIAARRGRLRCSAGLRSGKSRARRAGFREPLPGRLRDGADALRRAGLRRREPRRAAVAHGAQSAGQVHDGLVGTSLYPGVSGVTSIGADGDARKRPS